ncbi:hypothetical protein C0995_016003 [Termitomyces sp. Mi166|nr:hypothetical protein C0995_016003 [Termitomyces sp. Mi166\
MISASFTQCIFKRVYETPILKSRAPDASPKDIELGEARTAQVTGLMIDIVPRLILIFPAAYRGKELCTSTRWHDFKEYLASKTLDDLIQSSTAESLALINVLTKVSNSPILLKATADKAKADSKDTLQRSGVKEATRLIPEHAQIDDVTLSGMICEINSFALTNLASGKLCALAKLLSAIRSDTEEKCVLVSHYTSTLNILEAFCKTQKYSYFRLDGY